MKSAKTCVFLEKSSFLYESPEESAFKQNLFIQTEFKKEMRRQEKRRNYQLTHDDMFYY